MLTALSERLTDFNPSSDSFWAAISVLIAIVTLVIHGVVWGVRTRPAKKEQILLAGLVRNYTKWVSSKSRSQQVELGTLKEWLELGSVDLLGNDYSVFKSFCKRLKKEGYTIEAPDELWFGKAIENHQSAPKWSRSEW